MTPIKLSQVVLWPIPKIHTTHTYQFFCEIETFTFLTGMHDQLNENFNIMTMTLPEGW